MVPKNYAKLGNYNFYDFFLPQYWDIPQGNPSVFLKVSVIGMLCSKEKGITLFVENFLSHFSDNFRRRDFLMFVILVCAWHKLHLCVLK